MGITPVDADVPAAESARWGRTEEVTKRALCLVCVAMYCEGLDEASVRLEIDRYSLDPELTERERTLLAGPVRSTDEYAFFSWQGEAAAVLFWSLGLADNLDEPWGSETCERILGFGSPEAIARAVRWQNKGVIANESDFYARYYAAYERLVATLEPRPAVGLAPYLGPHAAPAVEHRWRAFRWLATGHPWETAPCRLCSP